MSADWQHEEHGTSSRQLVVIFLALVAMCAVFFSLGFWVGYNERPSASLTSTESVANPAGVPAPVNPPASSGGSAAGGQAAEPKRPATPLPAPSKTPASPSATRTEITAPTPIQPARRRPAEGPGKTPKIPSETAFSPAATGAGFAVQVMASRTQEDAQRLANMLRARGYPATVIAPGAASDGTNLFKVQVGPYGTRAAAETIRDKLARDGFKPFIRH